VGATGAAGVAGATGATGAAGATGPTGPTLPVASADTPSTLVQRDENGDFSAHTLTLDGNLILPAANGTTAGNIFLGGTATPILSADFTSSNVFLGVGTSVGVQPQNGALGNVALGPKALLSETTGDTNSAIGYSALTNNMTGSNNTAIGESSLYNNISGSDNIGIGAQAGMNVTTGSNNIDIGHQGQSGESNAIRIGTQGTQTAAYIAGIAGTTEASGVAVYVSNTGQLGTLSSSIRFKEDVHDIGDASRVLMSLRPVSFRYRPEYDPEGLQQYGLIAEEVEQKAPALVVYGSDGKPVTVRYNLVNALLLNEVQRQNAEIARLTARLHDSETQAQRTEAVLQQALSRLSAVESRLK
jgi:hypothetical protein